MNPGDILGHYLSGVMPAAQAQPSPDGRYALVSQRAVDSSALIAEADVWLREIEAG